MAEQVDTRPHIWTRDEIMLRLIQLQVGMDPPEGMPLEEAMRSFRSIAGENALRFERGAQFAYTEILAYQKRALELEGQLAAANERAEAAEERLADLDKQGRRETREKSAHREDSAK